MALNTEQIKNILSEGKTQGFDIRYRDILYCVGLKDINDVQFVYQCLYGVCEDVNVASTYNESANIVWLKERIKEELREPITDGEGILSNEENAAGLEKLLSDIKIWLDEDKITYKEYAELELKTRQRLAAMNGSKLRVDEQYIQVYHKYNTICPHCNKEYERDLDNE